jgi:RNA recognition motif-containing protein
MERPGEVRLLIRGIAKGVESTRIAEIFAPYGGDPERIALPRDRRTRRRKGIAYVFVPNERLAAAAIQALQNSELEEKTITIEIASERPPKVRRAFNGPRPPRRF